MMATYITFLLLLITSYCAGFSSSTINDSSDTLITNNMYMENVAAAVLVPGYLTGANDLKSLQRELTAQGLPTVVVPMANWHWLPVLGGRSVRPILERIDFTVQQLIAKLEQDKDFLSGKFPSFDYSYLDAWNDFLENPGGVRRVGGSSAVQDYPKDIHPRGRFPRPQRTSSTNNKKIALIGHSAGGWISRIYLSNQEYGGKVYDGSKYVHSLVTLGTPHAAAPGPAFEGINWINKNPPNYDVRSLAVAGKGFQGDRWGGLTQGSYAFCCPDGTDGSTYDGDGMTPTFSSLAMPNSESLILPQKQVNHFAWTDVGWVGKQVAPELYRDMQENGSLWYGSDEVVAEWLPWILKVTDETQSPTGKRLEV
jgi:pimeloyl-ACP methyl ester carboxylesterase